MASYMAPRLPPTVSFADHRSRPSGLDAGDLAREMRDQLPHCGQEEYKDLQRYVSIQCTLGRPSVATYWARCTDQLGATGQADGIYQLLELTQRATRQN